MIPVKNVKQLLDLYNKGYGISNKQLAKLAPKLYHDNKKDTDNE